MPSPRMQRRTFLKLFAGTAIATYLPIRWFEPHTPVRIAEAITMETIKSTTWRIPFVLTPFEQAITFQLPGIYVSGCFVEHGMTEISSWTATPYFVLHRPRDHQDILSLPITQGGHMQWQTAPGQEVLFPDHKISLSEREPAWLAGFLTVMA